MKQPVCLATGLLVLFAVIASPAVGQGLTLSDWGIQFPDGSMLTSATGVAPSNVLVVAKSGGHFASIQAAIDAIGGVGYPAATEESPYLIWVAPGVYEEHVTRKPWVGIHGAGTELTVIRSPGAEPYDRTVWTAANTELRTLAVENGFGGVGVDSAGANKLTDIAVRLNSGGTGISIAGGDVELRRSTVKVTGGQSAVGLTAFISGFITLHEAKLEASGATDGNTAIAGWKCVFVFSDVEARADGANAFALEIFQLAPIEIMGGPVIFEGTVSRANVLNGATVRGDVVAFTTQSGPMRIRNSVLEGNLVLHDDASQVQVVSSQLSGDAIGLAENFKCTWVIDDSGDPRGEHCEPVP